MFKAHPWEEKKTNIQTSFTRDALLNYIAGFPEEERERIKIVDHYPIEKIFANSDYIAGLNSQSLIEAAFNGLKPLQFGNAFFGGKGFTGDYSLNNCAGCVEDLISGKFSGTLTLQEYKKFEEFLHRLLQGQLVSVHDSGVSKLSDIFEGPTVIGLAKRVEPKGGALPATSEEKMSAEINTAMSVAVSSSKTSAVQKISHNVNKDTDSGKVSNSGLPKQNELKKNKKLRKFFANPRKFCADSNKPVLRVMRHIFPHKA